MNSSKIVQCEARKKRFAPNLRDRYALLSLPPVLWDLLVAVHCCLPPQTLISASHCSPIQY